jgi:O-methyltransferase involved in polyketide biosynthesis
MDDEAGDISRVPATMLVSLAARALARAVRPDMGFEDPYAEAIVDTLGIDAAECCTSLPAMLVTIYRSSFLDRVTRSFFRQHPDGVAINLACGLGTNFDRIASSLPSSSAWVDLDLPVVIHVRRRFFVDTLQRSMVEGDVETPTLFIIEGLLYYLTSEQVGALLGTIALARDETIQESQLVFDFVSPRALALSGANTDLQRTGTEFRWAFEGLGQVRRWNPALRMIAIGHHSEFVPDELRPLFFGALEQDGLPPAGVVHLTRSP